MNTPLDTLTSIACGEDYFLWHLMGALKVHDAGFLEEVAREFLRVYNPDALAGFDAIMAENIGPFTVVK